MNLTAQRQNGVAPSPEGFRLGGKGGTLARAWQYVWDRLDRAEFRQGQELAEEAGRKYALKPVSIMTLLHRMAKEGVLANETRLVEVEVQRTANRKQQTFPAKVRRAYFRIQP
jgi:hypothetical protein